MKTVKVYTDTYNCCGLKLNKTNVQVLATLGLGTASAAIIKYQPSVVSSVKSLATYYLINPFVFLPIIMLEMGMSSMGFMILSSKKHVGFYEALILKSIAYFFATLAVLTFILDLNV